MKGCVWYLDYVHNTACSNKNNTLLFIFTVRKVIKRLSQETANSFSIIFRHLKNQIIPKLQRDTLDDALGGVTQNFHPESDGPSFAFPWGCSDYQSELFVIFVFRSTRKS